MNDWMSPRDGVSRRELLKVLTVGCGGLVALAACGGAQAPAAAPASSAAAPATSAAAPASSAAARSSAAAAPASSVAAAAKPSQAASTASSSAASPAAASQSGAAKTLSPVKIGFAALSGNGTPVVVASDAGLFKQYGLPTQSTVIAGSPNTIAALVANEVHFAVVGASATAQAAINGADIAAISTLAPGLAFRFYSQPTINSIHDLKGKRVVQSNVGTDPDFALRLVLQKNNMSYSDVQSVHVSASDAARLEAMQASKAEAAIIGPGLFHVAEQQFHFKMLLDLIKEHIPYEQATIAVSRAFTKSHPDEVLAFVSALTASMKYVHDHRPETLASIKRYIKSPDNTQPNEIYDYYVTGGVFPKELFVSEQGVQTLLDLVAETNPKAKGRKAAEFIDNSFVQKLHDEGFVTKLYAS